MKIYHQLGHNYKWALDSHFKNDIGDGFIFSAFSFKYGAIEKGISSYKPENYLKKSMCDLQFYGSKDTVGGQLSTYPFNPVNLKPSDSTQVEGSELIEKAINYQESIGLKNVIVPIFYHEANDLAKLISYIKKINKRVARKKEKNKLCKYYMTLPFGNKSITNNDYVEELLQVITDMSIVFDGYYIVCDAKPEYKKKVSIDYDYYENLLKIFSVLNAQEFITIHGYSNWDSLVFVSLCDIDYVTIGTYENLRRFNIERFTESLGGGPSKGWYFSEKLLNFVRAEELKNLRRSNCLDLISNERNIFSDIILNRDYDWNTHKPDVHKNYLLSISRLLSDLSSEPSIKRRATSFLKRIERARQIYLTLESEHGVFLNDESSNYHLGAWSSIIKKHISG